MSRLLKVGLSLLVISITLPGCMETAKKDPPPKVAVSAPVVSSSVLSSRDGSATRSLPLESVVAAAIPFPPAVPSSQKRAIGSSWKTMHHDGYTGGFDTACRLLGLSARQCSEYKKAHQDGQCVVRKIQNGTVLDAMTYTGRSGRKAGKHFAQKRVKVALTNPLSRDVKLCRLDDGNRFIYVGYALGCNNHFRVNVPKKSPGSERKSLAKVPAIPAVSGKCASGRFLKLNIWENSAITLPGVQSTIDSAFHQTAFRGKRVSSSHGRQFRRAHSRGDLSRATRDHRVEVTLVKGENLSAQNTMPIGTIQVKGGLHKFEFRDTIVKDWDFVRFVFLDGGRSVVSPIMYSESGAHELRFFNRLPGKESGEWGGYCIMNVHAIESR